MNNNLSYDTTRQERIENLFIDIVEHIELSDDELEKYTQELCDIYSEKTFRHSYSLLSLALETYRPDQRDSLVENLKQIEHAAEKHVKLHYANDNNLQLSITSKIAKLCDHIDLETLRLARIDRVEYIGMTAQKDLTAADGKLIETTVKADELESRITNYHEQSITILGIFSGLVIAFSGVIQFTATGLESFTDASAFKITFFICLSFFFLFNIIFLMMYCISKIAKSSIASNCKNRNCQDCTACKNVVCKLRTKYPYVFWFEIVSITLCIVLCFIAIK